MLFLLEILDFFKDYKTKISNVLQEEPGKEIYIFPIAYGICLWSQVLKGGFAGKDLGAIGLFFGMVVVGSIVGMFLYYVFPYVLLWVSKIFVKDAKYKDLQKGFAWSLAPFLVGLLSVLLELLLGGQKLYAGTLLVQNEVSFRVMILGFTLFIYYFVVIYFVIRFVKVISYILKIQWWKTLPIIMFSAMIIMLPLSLLRL